MSKSFLCERIDQLSGQYPNKILSSLKRSICRNNYKLPCEFYLFNVSVATINRLLDDLDVDLKKVTITAPKGSHIPLRKISISQAYV